MFLNKLPGDAHAAGQLLNDNFIGEIEKLTEKQGVAFTSIPLLVTLLITAVFSPIPRAFG